MAAESASGGGSIAELTLQFLVMIDGPSSPAEVAAHLKAIFKDAVPVREHSLDLRGNWIEVLENTEADPKRARDEADGYLFYGYEMQSTPMIAVSEADQILLARDIVSAVNAKGWQAVVCANFEEKV